VEVGVLSYVIQWVVVLAGGAVVVVGGDPPHHAPAAATGVLCQGVGSAGAAGGRIDVEIVEGDGRGPGDGADVGEADDVPVGVVGDRCPRPSAGWDHRRCRPASASRQQIEQRGLSAAASGAGGVRGIG